MGLFDSLKNLGLEKIVDTIGESLETAADHVTEAIGQNGTSASSASTAQSTQYTPPQNTEYAAPQNNTVSAEQKFDQIFATDFADLQISKEVSAESVGISAPSPCRPYSYALRRGGQPVVVIMLTPHNRDRNAAFLNARAAAQNSDIVFLNFYTHYPNERDYVVSRIRSAL